MLWGFRCDETTASHQEYHGIVFNTKRSCLAKDQAFVAFDWSRLPQLPWYLALAVSQVKSCLSYPFLRFTSPSSTSSKVMWIQRRCIRVFRGLGISTSPTPPPWLLWLPQDPRAETGEVHPLGTCQHPSSSLQAKPIPAAGAQGLEVFLGWISDAENTMCLQYIKSSIIVHAYNDMNMLLYIFQVSNICGFATRKP